MNNVSASLKNYSRETFSSFRVRNYRLYYIGQIISTSGTFMQSVAQAWLVLKISNSGAALATVVGVLVEVPVMLSVCRICNQSRPWYERGVKGVQP